MAIKRVTMQDIADKCGLSRNTVSKIFNQRGNVPEETKELVLSVARELGYFQPTALIDGTEKADTNLSSLSIAVLSHSNPRHHNFGSFFIKAFTDRVCRAGYTVRMYEVSTEEIEERVLPPNISLENTAGILCIELFDKDYLSSVCSFGLPTIIVDGYQNITRSLVPCDVITMENVAASIAIMNRLISNGAKSIGFVGDITHCNSFNERWNGFSVALDEAGIKIDKDICILDSNNSPYGDLNWLDSKIEQMPYIPDAFFCANDFHALHMLTAIKRRGLSVPKDVMISGFDNSPESAIVEPGLTTAQIPSQDIGVTAAEVLLARIENPNHSYCISYIKSTPIFRDSTR